MMLKKSTFIIENDADIGFDVFVEPEGVIVTLAHEEKLVVKDEYEDAPVTLRISRDEKGNIALCIWPGDGDTRVEKNGLDVLEG